jgi:hypothetical protein
MQSHILLNGNIMESFTKGDQADLSVCQLSREIKPDLSVCQLSREIKLTFLFVSCHTGSKFETSFLYITLCSFRSNQNEIIVQIILNISNKLCLETGVDELFQLDSKTKKLYFQFFTTNVGT